MLDSATGGGRRLVALGRDGRSTFRQHVYAILEEGQTEGTAGLLVEIVLITLIVSNVVMVILETVPSIHAAYAAWFSGFETFTVYTFALEYILRVWSSVEDPRIGTAHPVSGRMRFALRPLTIIDFLAFAPYFITLVTGGVLDLRALRILRLLRLLKITRYSQAMPAMLGVLYAERRALLGSFILLLCTVCISAEIMHLAEGSVQPKVFGTLPGAMYWAITTLSTVGYGDAVPVTMLGKLIAGFTMIAGLVLFAMPIGIIATGFVNGLHRREFNISWSMVKRQPLFGDFSIEAVSRIVDLMGATMVQEHTRITVSGQAADRFYLIISGRARAEDDEHSWELEAGDMIGEEALGDDGRYARTVTARSEMRLMVLPAEELQRLARKYPLLARRLTGEATW